MLCLTPAAAAENWAIRDVATPPLALSKAAEIASGSEATCSARVAVGAFLVFDDVGLEKTKVDGLKALSPTVGTEDDIGTSEVLRRLTKFGVCLFFIENMASVAIVTVTGTLGDDAD